LTLSARIALLKAAKVTFILSIAELAAAGARDVASHRFASTDRECCDYSENRSSFSQLLQ